MGLTDVKHAGGETSMAIKSPVIPTVSAKRKARRKKDITEPDIPPPPPAEDEVKIIVQARVKEKLKEKQYKNKSGKRL